MHIITVLGVLDGESERRWKTSAGAPGWSAPCMKLSASGAAGAEFGRQLCPLPAV